MTPGAVLEPPPTVPLGGPRAGRGTEVKLDD